ncbi:hypothetical protein KVR01_009427 [Diaporthe batatas]|uniref:uncharacterized protein n=1 Tax=Diaporthe batatas TaxID=748121 RepID=UPI001D049115|nr:uncharacterized protein KVR01_009427 [Diaporthe batatas]KAG8161163.1 hypothetical protein KVR01_009427 [Diaporthe batatas]
MNEPITVGTVSSTDALETQADALSDLGLEAIDLFGKLKKALREGTDEKLREDSFTAESQRFELWAANMGLFVPGHGSLDYRVREAEKLAQTLRRFMQDLNTSLEDVVEMCSEPKQEGASAMSTSSGEESESHAQEDEAKNEGDDEDEDEDEEPWDTDLLIDSVRDPINRLFKMSIKIRNPSTRLGSSRAANYRQVDEETGVDLLQAMKEFDLDYVKTVFLEYRKTKARRDSRPAQPPGDPPGEHDDNVWEPIKTVLTEERERENSGGHSYLIDRIAQANVRRRQQFAYWAAHRHKLDKHTKAYQAQKGRFPVTERQTGGGLGLELAQGPLPSISSATGLDMARLEISSDTRSNWALSEYAPSTRRAADAPVDFPPAPKVSRKTQADKFFECPYCFFLCPKDILAEKAWKAHLIHDLRPYICTYEDCRNPTQLYDSRKDWVQHENSEHRKVWRCPEHENKVFESIDGYRRHLRERHAGSIGGEASLARIIQASESVADTSKRACPICTVELDTGRAMEGHIALHLERFASFSLPRSVDNDDDGSNADSGKANRVDEEGSRDDDFEGGFEYHSQVNSSGTQSAGRPPEVGISSPRDETGAFGVTLLEKVEDLGSSDESSNSDSGQSQDEMPTDRLKVGEWCADFEKYEKVEREFLETLEQTERRLGGDHEETRNCMKRVYDLLRGQKKFLEAEHILRRILEQTERALGPDHQETWASMSELGWLLHEQGRYAESEQMNWEVLALRENAWGREDPETLVSLSNLAIALSLQGKVAEAEVLGREAMEARRRLLGPSHKNTLISMANLAHMLMGLGRVDEAEKLCGEVIEIQKQEFGHDHPETLISMKRMAQVLYAQNKVEETEKLELEVLEAFRQTLGPTHPDTLASLYTVASFLHSQGRWDEAVGLMDECFQLRRQVLGLDHQYTRAAAKNLDEWRAKLGEPDE